MSLRTLRNALESHCRLKHFKLDYDKPEDFVHSVLFITPMPYAALVSCMFLYTITMVFYTAFNSKYGATILIWLTYWSFYALTLRVAITAVNAWVHVFDGVRMQRKNTTKKAIHREESLPVLYKIQWLLQNTSACTALIVSILYWAVMFSGKSADLISVNSHGINSVFVLADLFLSRAPVRIHHFIYTVLFMIIYVIFSIIYWAAGGKNYKGQSYIYFLLDYSNKPGLAVGTILGVVLVVVPLIQVFLYCLYRLRQWFWSKYGRGRTLESTHSETKKSIQFSINRKSDRRGHDSGNESDGKRENSLKDSKENFLETSYVTAPDDEPEAEIDVDLDFEMDEILQSRPPRPPLMSNPSEVSTTESTHALLPSP